jgi:predicted DNA-binding transcriptional regulator AlpA
MTEGTPYFREVRVQRTFTAKQVANLLQVSERTLEKWRRERRGPGFTRSSSRMVRYPEAEVAQWIELNTAHRTGEESASFSSRDGRDAKRV